jgi:hypothetical protein
LKKIIEKDALLKTFQDSFQKPINFLLTNRTNIMEVVQQVQVVAQLVIISRMRGRLRREILEGQAPWQVLIRTVA